MGMRHPNPRLIKIHRSYTVAEAAEICRVHRNTVRHWLQRGLPAVEGGKPFLILGADLKRFLHARREAGRRPCQPGEIYCVKCRLPRKPTTAEYKPLTAISGNLTAFCPHCGIRINRRVTLARLGEIQGEVLVTMPQAPLRIIKTA